MWEAERGSVGTFSFFGRENWAQATFCQVLCQLKGGLSVREHIICPVFVARDLSGLGWSLKEGHDDTGDGSYRR